MKIILKIETKIKRDFSLFKIIPISILYFISLLNLFDFITSEPLREINPLLKPDFDFTAYDNIFLNVNMGYTSFKLNIKLQEELGALLEIINNKKILGIPRTIQDLNKLMNFVTIKSSEFSNQKCNNLNCLKGSLKIIANQMPLFTILYDVEVYSENGKIINNQGQQEDIGRGHTRIFYKIDHKLCSVDNSYDFCQTYSLKPYDAYYFKFLISIRNNILSRVNYSEIQKADYGNFKFEFNFDTTGSSSTSNIPNDSSFEIMVTEMNPFNLFGKFNPLPDYQIKYSSNFVTSQDKQSNITYYSPGARQQVEFNDKKSLTSSFMEIVPIAIHNPSSWSEYLENQNFGIIEKDYSKQNGVYESNLYYLNTNKNTTLQTSLFNQQIFAFGDNISLDAYSHGEYSWDKVSYLPGEYFVVYSISKQNANPQKVIQYDYMNFKFDIALRINFPRNYGNVYLKASLYQNYQNISNKKDFDSIKIKSEKNQILESIDLSEYQNVGNYCSLEYCYLSFDFSDWNKIDDTNKKYFNYFSIKLSVLKRNPNIVEEPLGFKMIPSNGQLIFKNSEDCFSDINPLDFYLDKTINYYDNYITTGITYVAELYQGKPIDNNREINSFIDKFTESKIKQLYSSEYVTDMTSINKLNNPFIKKYGTIIKKKYYIYPSSKNRLDYFDGKINTKRGDILLDLTISGWPFCFFNWPDSCPIKTENKLKIGLTFSRKVKSVNPLEKLPEEFRIIPIVKGIKEVNRDLNRDDSNNLDSLTIYYEVPLPYDQKTNSEIKISFFIENPSKPFQNNATLLIIIIVSSVIGFLIFVGIGVFICIRAKKRSSFQVQGNSRSVIDQN